MCFGHYLDILNIDAKLPQNNLSMWLVVKDGRSKVVEWEI